MPGLLVVEHHLCRSFGPGLYFIYMDRSLGPKSHALGGRGCFEILVLPLAAYGSKSHQLLGFIGGGLL
jgi:hypothetical protein